MPSEACPVCKHAARQHASTKGCALCPCTRTWYPPKPELRKVVLNTTEPVCVSPGCGHTLDHHRIHDMKIWTQYTRKGEVKTATMQHSWQCFDVCSNHEPKAHQCHCTLFKPNVPPPTNDELAESERA